MSNICIHIILPIACEKKSHHPYMNKGCPCPHHPLKNSIHQTIKGFITNTKPEMVKCVGRHHTVYT